jgi:predicted metalloprotease
MRLDNQRESRNVEDRRGETMRRGSIAIGTLVIALAASYFFGIDPALILDLEPSASARAGKPAGTAANHQGPHGKLCQQSAGQH